MPFTKNNVADEAADGRHFEYDGNHEAAYVRSDFERLSRLLAGLPERERELVALKYGSGMTNRAIAKATGLSESNVGTILHRTVGQLRAAWTERT